jgi:hypothetical protein
VTSHTPRDVGGIVCKSPEGWSRFRVATDNGARKRPGFRPLSLHTARNPKGVRNG